LIGSKSVNLRSPVLQFYSQRNLQAFRYVNNALKARCRIRMP
jgi:hypothetical protein